MRGLAGFWLFVPSTGEANMIVAYCDSASVLVKGVVAMVSAGWPGERPIGGSQTSTVKPCSWPSLMTALVVSSMWEWRKPSVLPTTSTL